MKLIYFKDKINFGDQLNKYIIDKLFTESFYLKHENVNFVGIGTIIDERIREDQKTVIFGTGIRDVIRKFAIDNWDIRFLRGKITAKCLNVSDDLVISDSAYCLNLITDNKTVEKEYDVSLIPYFTQVDIFNWGIICRQLGINLISPQDDVENIISQIKKSKRIISGSLHGAIVADVFRVPWIRLIIGEPENKIISEIKWLDWLSSINLKINEIKIPVLPYGTNKYFKKKLLRIVNNKLIHYYLKSELGRKEFYLSDSAIIQKINEQISRAIKSFATEYGIKLRIQTI